MDSTDELIGRTTLGDLGAWRDLQRVLSPQITSIARSHPSMRQKGLASLPDDVAEVHTLTLERLARDNFENLRSFLAQQQHEAGPPSFERWLYGAVDFSVRHHLRARFGRPPKPEAGSDASWQPSKRDLNTNAERLDGEEDVFSLDVNDVLGKLTLAEIFTHAQAKFVGREARALELYYIEDQSFEAIARTLKLASAKDAESMIRRLNARLRYHFMQADPARKSEEGTH